MKRLLVGIAGGSGAGKSVVARRLSSRLGGTLIELDSYYVDRSDISPAQRAEINYDEPAAFDVPLLLRHLATLRRGGEIAKPMYCFTTHTRSGSEAVKPIGDLIVVEGLFTLWWPDLRQLLDVKVFVDAPADVRLARRIERDVCERGRKPEQTLQQYAVTVRPMHDRYVEPTRHLADVVVTNDRDVEVAVESIATSIRTGSAHAAN